MRLLYSSKDFLFRVIKIVQWLPVLWKDEDWDYIYLLRLIDYKLKRMGPVIANGWAAHAQHKALEIEQTRLAIANIEDDPDNEWDLHCDQWHTGKQVKDKCPKPKECRQALKAATAREKRNWSTLWVLLNIHAQGWWD